METSVKSQIALELTAGTSDDQHSAPKKANTSLNEDPEARLFYKWEREPGEGGPEDDIQSFMRKTKKRFAISKETH